MRRLDDMAPRLSVLRRRPAHGSDLTGIIARSGLAVATALLLAGCGQREVLQPPPGASLPPKPALAATVPTSTELLTPRTEERPERSEELLTKSQERPDDRFDLPPPG